MIPFNNFPTTILCPICSTSDNKPGVLVPIDGTVDGRNEKAAPTHVECLNGLNFRYEMARGIFYAFL